MISLQERLQTVEQTNRSLIEDGIVQKFRIEQLETDLNKAKTEKEQIQTSYQAKIEVDNLQLLSIITSRCFSGTQCGYVG